MLEATHPPPRPPCRVLFWCETTARQSFVTGVQRVVRHLGAGLEAVGITVVPVGWDGRARVLKVLSEAERHQLGFGHGELPPLDGVWNDRQTWLLLPETPATWHVDLAPARLGRAYGIRTAALVHDMIPVARPELYPAEVTAHFSAAFRSFADLDLVLTTTEHVASGFRRLLAEAGLVPPAMEVVPLGGDALAPERPPPRPEPVPDAPLSLLMVGTWEPRKNHLRVLRALARLQAAGVRVRLTIVGRRGQDPGFDQAVLADAARLADVSIRHRASDTELRRLMAGHDATIYPSYEEGFGLPVLESLWMGLPCLCHAGTGTLEVAQGGGTLAIDMLDEATICTVLCRLALDRAQLRQLQEEARARPIRSWRAAAGTLGALLTTRPD